MTKGLIVRTDFTKDYIDINDYKDIQKVVGGFIESINFGENQFFCYANEEAKLLGLEPNELATSLWYDSGQVILLGDCIAGDVVFFGGIDDEGNDIDISEDFHNVFSVYEI